VSPRAAGATQHELSRIGLLETLGGETLARLAQRMTREEVPAGAQVVTEGDDGDRFYVVLSGMLNVSQESLGERRTLKPGDYFGEVALIDEGARTATITATTGLVCYGLTSWEFKPLVEGNGRIAWKLLQTLAKRLRASDQRDT
jgi:CRP-like cAMP-binding protein